MMTDLHEQLEWAARQLERCTLCPHQCRVNRGAGQTGYCGAPAAPEWFTDFVHYGEEEELVPSHVVYLTGCNLACKFCHTADERKILPAEKLTPAKLSRLIERGKKDSARNINFLGGEPGVNLPGLLRLFAETPHLPPIIWNSNFYCSEESLQMLAPLAYNYLADLKAGNRDCAAALTGAEDYLQVVQQRLLEVHGRCPERLIVRHLVLPGHVECCTRPALKWLASNLPNARVSLMLEYVVMPAARNDSRLGRFLTEQEIADASAAAYEAGVSLVKQASTASQRTAATQGGKPLDIEIVLAPDGRMFLRHPTREALDIAKKIANPDSAKEKK